jgi:hypothetical protein
MKISFVLFYLLARYSVTQLFDLLHEIGDHYNEVLMQRWVQVFRELLEQESFIPIQVSPFIYH